jgi:hypothetical protein
VLYDAAYQALFGFQLIEWIAAKSRLHAFKCRHRLAPAARFNRRSSYIFSQEKTTFQGCGESMTISEVLYTLSKSMHLCASFIVMDPIRGISSFHGRRGRGAPGRRKGIGDQVVYHLLPHVTVNIRRHIQCGRIDSYGKAGLFYCRAKDARRQRPVLFGQRVEMEQEEEIDEREKNDRVIVMPSWRDRLGNLNGAPICRNACDRKQKNFFSVPRFSLRKSQKSWPGKVGKERRPL